MSAFHQPLPDTSLDVDTQLLSRINMLTGLSQQQNTSMSEEDSHTSATTVDGNTGSPSSSSSLTSVNNLENNTETLSVHEVGALAKGDSPSAPKPDKGEDEGVWEKQAPPEPADAPRIIARYTYPSENRPTPVSPPSFVCPLISPPLSSLLGRISDFVGSYFDTSPAIIEYSDRQIKKKTKVRVEVQKVELPSSTDDEKVIRVVALVSNGVTEDGEATTRPVEIKAKHKRVREIMKDNGVSYVAEEVYKKEIRGAFRKLKKG